MSNHVRTIFTVPAAIILTEIGFRLFHHNPGQLSLKLTVVKYAGWLVLVLPLYWIFGKFGNPTMR